MANLVRLSKLDRTPGFPVKSETLYAWRKNGKYPGIFVQLGKGIFLDLDRFEKIVEENRNNAS